MPPLSIMIKPASGSCNVRCRYCFYADEAANREVASYGRMSDGTLKAMVRLGLENATGACTFAFQGGEPTLVGLDFYRRLMGHIQTHNHKNLRVNLAIQTNGMLMGDEWAAFLAQNNFLTGLSLDGPPEMHDANRVNAAGDGTQAAVMRAAACLERHGAQFNVLTVVTANTARHIEKIYKYFKKNGLLYQQYIPCLDPINEQRGGHPFSLTPERYAEFLKKLFDLWYRDITSGQMIYIRYFENLAGMLLDMPPESCGMLGRCTMQYVVEADGGVYPCDFYVMDPYRLGNVNTDTLAQMDAKRAELRFIEDSMAQAPECAGCQWRGLCRGGCRRDRDYAGRQALGLNYFCSAYKAFFTYAAPRLAQLAARLGQGRR